MGGSKGKRLPSKNATAKFYDIDVSANRMFRCPHCQEIIMASKGGAFVMEFTPVEDKPKKRKKKKKSKKTLKTLNPKPATKASRKARGRLLKSINPIPSGKALIGKRRTSRR